MNDEICVKSQSVDNGCKSIKHNCNLMIKTDFIKADTDGFGFFSIILSIVNCQLSID